MLLVTVEEEIREVFLPALFGKGVQVPSRGRLGLPFKGGGLGMYDPMDPLQTPYDTSRLVTAHLDRDISGEEEFRMITHVGQMRKGRREALNAKWREVDGSLQSHIEGETLISQLKTG